MKIVAFIVLMAGIFWLGRTSVTPVITITHEEFYKVVADDRYEPVTTAYREGFIKGRQEGLDLATGKTSTSTLFFNPVW